MLKACGMLQRLSGGSEIVISGAEQQLRVMKWISRHFIHLLLALPDLGPWQRKGICSWEQRAGEGGWLRNTGGLHGIRAGQLSCSMAVPGEWQGSLAVMHLLQEVHPYTAQVHLMF